MMIRIAVVLLLVASLAGSADVIRGPPRAERSAVKHVARIGQDVKLKCAIDAFPPPLFSWSKEGETIDYTWDRFRTNNKILKIRAVEPEDSGIYYCKGINGFGTAEVRIDLMVIDLKDFPGLSEADLARLAPPSFPAEASQQQLIRMLGDTVRLSCVGEGWPEPQLSWYRDGEQLMQERSNTLLLRQVTGRDSAVYSCLAQNLVGSAAIEYTLQVQDEQALQPDIRLGQANLTVHVGDTARLDCRVRSAQLPHIKWLRRLEAGSARSEDDGGEIIPVGEEKYRLIPSSRTMELSSEEYLSQLVLHSVEPSTAGLYVCLVTTASGGFNFQRSFLTVNQKLNIADEELAPLAVIIAVAAVLLLALVVLTAICCLQRRRRQSLVKNNATSEPVKVNNNKMAAPLTNFRGKDDIQIAVNKMEDLLQHNTQQLLLSGANSNLYVETTANLYVESGHNNHDYEVPHSERYGYYDLRDVGRTAAMR